LVLVCIGIRREALDEVLKIGVAVGHLRNAAEWPLLERAVTSMKCDIDPTPSARKREPVAAERARSRSRQWHM